MSKNLEQTRADVRACAVLAVAFANQMTEAEAETALGTIRAGSLLLDAHDAAQAVAALEERLAVVPT